MNADQLRTAAVAVLATAAACLALAPQAQAAPVPQPQSATAEVKAAAGQAAAAPATMATLSRFFAREGKVAVTAAQPRVEGEAIGVNYLSPDFVAGKAGAPVARLEFLASKAVSSDGQQAALWTARTEAGWQVVNIATGDDEFRYARLGAEKLPGGTVFREPQIDAWYVARGAEVLPLDEDAERAVGAGGTSLAAYRARVARAYGDKLPGSAYAKAGKAGGYAGGSAGSSPDIPAGAAAGGLALAGAGVGALIRRRRALRP
ncbi:MULTISPECIES: hypothetical protein [unclassified Streptomyces]|uniref:hypothetical protein n=1 Tax=unclassified Streptomyces TaxID=2593676 RepID=UPI002E331118|nr:MULTISPECIES: hypothetical protein [unclassified Streptomyces]WUC66963.1 hypothetical protein OG861_23570 [Streptomyces sp. NBC_00539]